MLHPHTPSHTLIYPTDRDESSDRDYISSPEPEHEYIQRHPTENMKPEMQRIYDNIGYEYEEECQSEAETTTSPYKPSHTKVFLIDQVCTMKKKKGRGANTLYYRYAYATDDREDDAMYSQCKDILAESWCKRLNDGKVPGFENAALPPSKLPPPTPPESEDSEVSEEEKPVSKKRAATSYKKKVVKKRK